MADIETNGHLTPIDLMDGGRPRKTSAYILTTPKATLVETGGSRSQGEILAAIASVGLVPEDIRYIAVTHVHLDHAGGVGSLLSLTPNAQVIVHPKGAPHLIDPSRLIEGSRAAHGDAWEAHFGPVLPVPEDRLLVPVDGDTIDLGEGWSLECLDTPGHAFHHFAFFERKDRTLFPGDVMGMIYPDLSHPGDPYILPSTAPSQFDPEIMRKSCLRLAELPAAAVAFSHFGPASLDLHWLTTRLSYVVNGWLDATHGLPSGADRENVGDAIRAWIRFDLEAMGRTYDERAEEIVNPDVAIDAGGFEAYYRYLERVNRRG